MFAFTGMNCSFSQTGSEKKRTPMQDESKKPAVYSRNDTAKLALPDAEWKKMLTP